MVKTKNEEKEKEEELLREYSEKLSSSVFKLVKSKLKLLLLLPPPPVDQPGEILSELRLPVGAAAHDGHHRPSVIAVGFSIIEKDRRATEIQKELGLHRVTVYRALKVLRNTGFTRSKRGLWTLNQERCPALFWLTRVRRDGEERAG